MAKGLMLLVAALMLDYFQAMIMLSFMGVVSTTSTFLAFIPVVGTGAAGVVTVGGMLTGEVIDIALSFGFGTLIVTLLLFTGTFSGKAFLWGTPVELFLPFLPGWTAIVGGSLYNTYKADKAREAQTNEALA